MALPPLSLGARVHPVRLVRLDARRWGVTVDEHPLPAMFGSEEEAREAGIAELTRLDTIALALLRRVRSRSIRKRP